jgi:dihydrofolate reductase
MHAVASLDGYIANEHDDVGRLHEWLFNGDPDRRGGPWRADRSRTYSAVAAETRNGALWTSAVVVSHRPKPEGWHPEASYQFTTSVQEAVALAQEPAGDGDIGAGRP